MVGERGGDSVENDYTRINATAAFARVAEDFPQSVGAHVPTLVDRLDDEEALVRENACWALGHLRAESAVDALRDRRRDDEPKVSERAAWALDEIRSESRNGPQV